MSKHNYVEIWLGMFKQGDDLAHHLEHTLSPAEAFEEHALQMEAVAQHLYGVAKAIRETETNSNELVSVEAGTHHIGLSGPAVLVDRLIAEDLGFEPEWLDEEEEWDEEELTEEYGDEEG